MTLRLREEHRRGQVFAEEESPAQRGNVGREGGEADVDVFVGGGRARVVLEVGFVTQIRREE